MFQTEFDKQFEAQISYWYILNLKTMKAPSPFRTYLDIAYQLALLAVQPG